jgi:hypothetical protein
MYILMIVKQVKGSTFIEAKVYCMCISTQMCIHAKIHKIQHNGMWNNQHMRGRVNKRLPKCNI